MYSPRIARPMCISMYAIHVRYMYPRDTYHDTRIATAQVRNTIGYDRIHLRYVLPMYPIWIRHVFYVCILRARHNTYSIRVEYTHDTYPCQIHNTIHPGIHVYYMYPTYVLCIPYTIPPNTTYQGVPGLKKVQNKMKKMKGAQAAGVQVTSLLEMKQFLTPIRIPICIPYVFMYGSWARSGNTHGYKGNTHGFTTIHPNTRNTYKIQIKYVSRTQYMPNTLKYV